MKTKKLMKFALIIALTISCSNSDSVTAPIPVPVAYNDLYTTIQNKEIVISDILKNDDNTEGTTLELITTTTKGEAVNADGIITFTPENNFIGTDSFKYTICETVENNCSTATVFIKVEKGNAPKAVNDSYTTIANKIIIIDDLTSNDILSNNAVITSVEPTSNTTGSVELNNSIVTYTPKEDFTGEDEFTYTICDNNQNCADALVTITIQEGIKAVNDNYNTSNTSILTISNLTTNDIVINGTKITELSTTSTQGTAELQTNGDVIYTPKMDFTGQDTFTYTICDDDTANQTCSTATVTISVLAPVSFNIPSELQAYYNDVLFVEDSDILYSELKDVTKTRHSTILSYGQRHDFLYNADEDPNNTANVLLMYTGESRDEREWVSGNNTHSPQTFNTEHVYPQSLYAGGEGGIDKDEIVKADLHHLRACDADVNSDRSNRAFTEGTGDAKIVNNEWYPGDEWKGDVARIIMYLNVRYGETFTKVGDLNLFLKWNIEDPVSAFEEQRNEVIYAAQGNRNPFIDNPYLATLIWGSDAAENKWQ